ncbi:MAG: pilus assembly protein TadG-related protein, partial [Anaerolineales bacterium]
MFTKRAHQERGQAMVLLVLAMVGILGFAAVALDGGNIYTEQRRAQSAADSAVLAAAYRQMKGSSDAP